MKRTKKEEATKRVTMNLRHSSQEEQVIPERTRIRFEFGGRWKALGLADGWIDVYLSETHDGIEIRGSELLTIQATSGNSIVVASMPMLGGATEVGRLRRTHVDLINRINEAEDPMRKRQKGGPR